MDSYDNHSYNYNYNYDYYFDNQPIWGFPSSASTFQTTAGAPPPAVAANLDEEAALLLASSCPKKRTGRRKFKETRHPVYRGIRRRNSNKWVCELRTTSNDKCKLQQCPSRIWLGTYPTAEMAARAHDVAALALRGRNACLNFADSASILRVPTSGDIKEIQRAAAEAGEMFNPSPHEWTTGENSRLETIEDEEGYSTSEEKYTTKPAAEESVEVVQESSSPTGIDYMDDAAMLARMSEGTLLSPQHHHHEYHGGGTDAPWSGFGWDDQMDGSDNYGGDLSLWSWSWF